MKKINRTYFILAYLFFIYPPFLSGLVSIYIQAEQDIHIVSLWLNLFLIAIIGLVCYVLYINKKIHIPITEERRYLLFGLLSNVVVYFYTFQNLLNMENIVNVYLVLLLILGFYYLLIERKFRPKELWLLMPIYLVYDYVVYAVRGCGWGFFDWYCIPNTQYDEIFKYTFLLILIGTVLYYVYRVILYRLFDIFKGINIVVIIYLSFAAVNFNDNPSDFTLTMMILYPFFVVVDFIVKLVNKQYSHKMLLFYIRTFAIFIVFFSLGTTDFYSDFFQAELLFLLVTLTYFSLGISILKFILKIDVKDENVIEVIKSSYSGPQYKIATSEDVQMIKEEYSVALGDHMKLDDNSYSLVVLLEGKIIGFISTFTQQLKPPLESQEAFINVIEVHHEHRNQGIATKLIQKTENHFKSQGIKQIRAWSSTDKYEAINLWNKLNYTMNPTTVHYGEEAVEGYFASKKL